MIDFDRFTKDPIMLVDLGELIRDYTYYKSVSMSARMEGNMARALVFEAKCDEIYQRFPRNLRWRDKKPYLDL
jgi:hypothetical protein